MDILILCLAHAFGILIGWNLRERVAMKIVEKMMDDIQQVEEEERTKMRLETHSGVIYAYTADGNHFIAQGVNLNELDKAIIARFPGKKFSVQEQNLIDIKAEYNESV